jgi:hypothetical protein
MKKYIYIVALLFLSQSCEKVFDKMPQGNPTTDEFYKNLTEMSLGVNAIYDILGTDFWQQNHARIGSGASDEMTHQTAKLTPAGEVVTYKSTPQNQLIVDYWQTSYKAIFRTNMVIANAEKVVIYDQVAGTREQFHDLLGQAKFLRAFFYFNLARTFGGVPIKPEAFSIDANGNDNFIQPRSNINEVYKYIEKDLRMASVLLYSSNRGDQSRNGIVTRGAAISLLAKVIAYQAKPGVNDPRWHEVLKFTDHLVNSSVLTLSDILNLKQAFDGESLPDITAQLYYSESSLTESLKFYNEYNFSLSPSYDLMFHAEGENTPEWIFYVNHIANPTTSFSYGSNGTYPGGLTDLQPNKYYHDLSLSTNDPRLLSSIAGPGRVVYEGTGFPSTPLGGNADPAKTMNLKWDNYRNEEPQKDSERNFGILRYGEMILWHAEALNETGDPRQAIDEINKLRVRARLIPLTRLVGLSNTIKNVPYGTYLQVRNAIWTERQYELHFEFDRFFDLQRTGQMKEQILKKNKSTTSDYQVNYIDEINKLFPIPQWEIDISNGAVVQNTGY